MALANGAEYMRLCSGVMKTMPSTPRMDCLKSRATCGQFPSTSRLYIGRSAMGSSTKSTPRGATAMKALANPRLSDSFDSEPTM